MDINGIMEHVVDIVKLDKRIQNEKAKKFWYAILAFGAVRDQESVVFY